ncbi:TetR/AcrR family transcriptional regulator [Streptomyces sp. NPDC005426]|uniref:TetR/AcrR family transcriptional regulator n=1 Tax=Streptomyces sp. NPDC005426 TaxID=3155344 RepID=UPI0033B309D7
MAEVRRERADAARNRRAILRVTEELLAVYRPEEISMERVAAAAGVGKGTVFHRFGSRVGLMDALIQDRALALHDAVVSGPPPLGPDADPRSRLFAFLDGIVDVVARNKGLLAALGHAATTTQRPKADDGHPVYRFWHGHLSTLLAELRPSLDAELVAHVLLSTLGSEPILQLLEKGEGERLAVTLRLMVTTLLDT